MVDQNGDPVTRLRAGWRALIVWSPLLTFAMCASVANVLGGTVLVALLLAAWSLFLVGGLRAVLVVERGIQDRLAGTWLVPK